MKSTLEMPKATINKGSAEPQNFDVHERIRSRAFELYEQRGREDGHELDDWLQAEAEATIELAA